jgi:cadmium resistance protein CadD (predicted permease)
MIVLTLIAASVVIFASTNVDDLFVLIGFFSNPDISRPRIVAGQLVGMAVIVGASLAAVFAALAISPPHVGLLGLAPLAIGAKKLWDLARAREAPKSDPGAQPRGGRDAIAIAAVTVANSGDNLAVYAPLFASQKFWQSAIACIVFAIMTVVWCLAAWLLVSRPKMGPPIRRVGRIALPVALIGLGGAVLYESGALALLAGLGR